jgi:chorismate dehydratase
MPPTLGVHDALYLRPLLYGLERSKYVASIHIDIPARLALNFSQRIPPLDRGCAFLSPIAYAKHAANYRIIPEVAVSSREPTGTIQLIVNQSIRNIKTVAVDVRVVSEIILAKIILQERYSDLTSSSHNIQFIPMMPDVGAMLVKADAALIVNSTLSESRDDLMVLDLVEEWNDLTDLPYVHGFWVGYESDTTEEEIRSVIHAADEGVAHMDDIARQSAGELHLAPEAVSQYLSSFSYGFGSEQHDSVSEFIHYAFYSGILPDAPEIKFFDVQSPRMN